MPPRNKRNEYVLKRKVSLLQGRPDTRGRRITARIRRGEGWGVYSIGEMYSISGMAVVE